MGKERGIREVFYIRKRIRGKRKEEGTSVQHLKQERSKLHGTRNTE